ncbi:MAG: hypothetical protein ACOYEV_16765 [Candidatus Nanopelagicales bacterium]
MITQLDWETFQTTHSVGDVITGIVEDVLPFGSFVATGGVVGLLYGVQRASGEQVRARILAIDPLNRRFSLEPA